MRDHMLDLILSWLCVPADKEVYEPCTEAGRDGLHMDIVIYGGGKMLIPAPLNADGTPAQAPLLPGWLLHSLKALLLDMHLTDQMRLKFRHAPRAGKAAELGAKKKFTHYNGTFSRSRNTLFPFVAEFDGLLGLHAHVFLSAAADHQHLKSNGVWLRSECLRGWRQSISLALQEVISLTILRTMSRTVAAAVENQAQPDLLAYKRVRLLCPPNVHATDNYVELGT